MRPYATQAWTTSVQHVSTSKIGITNPRRSTEIKLPLSRKANNPRTPQISMLRDTGPAANLEHRWTGSLSHEPSDPPRELRPLNIEIGGAGGHHLAARWQFNFPLRSCSGPCRCALRRRNARIHESENTATALRQSSTDPVDVQWHGATRVPMTSNLSERALQMCYTWRNAFS